MPAKKKPKTATKGRKVPIGGLRTLGTEKRKRDVRSKAKPDASLARKAAKTLRAEFERVFALKEKLGAESRIGATEKGRTSARQDEKLRSLVASLEGMSRFALQMGLVTPAESREIYAEAMKRGLYQGWK